MSHPAPQPAFAIGSDLPVRRLGYGTVHLTGHGAWGPRGTDADASSVLRRAVELGVTLIDTADNYGPGIAEERVAAALHPYAEGLVIATKGGVVRTSADAWHIEGRPDRLRAMCEASLRRLRVDRIDLYQLHRFDPDVPAAEQLGALRELRDEGKIRHVGLDSVRAEQLQEALDLGIVPIVSVQNRYNVLDRVSEPLLKLCEAHGIAFLPWFPLGNGTLTGHPALTEIAAAHGATPSQVALAWLLHHSPVLCPTPGTGSVAHLEENVAAARLRLTDEDLVRLDALTAADV
ncbi:aldo/keto reductase [Streptomyces sp. VRA16 Mangrove soil]|uniref:aldo/keto reductase n=1 Tax=Streptomyces sp. VRA16 Mangrove soil TaxID=2817434 RepID=UPI001A9F2E1C|nr:aldo/keto reductase [Streptomyces sp. VRA16 Mangrove soil]MBO1335486.1 aldo/keto reductase [Streptomyces sp. VRA16 Mangrove soil]